MAIIQVVCAAATLLVTVSGAEAAQGMTCDKMKGIYKAGECCGNPSKAVSIPGYTKDDSIPACPYNFAKPACKDANVQAPRDLSTGAQGAKTPKAATLNRAQAEFLPQVNVHYHLGAEHKSDEYNNDTDSKAFDAGHRRLAAGAAVRPGFMCPIAGMSEADLAPYQFKYCKGDVAVGKSYEVHYVHSSAGGAVSTDDMTSEDMADGLGGAANGRGMLNPMVVVQGQVFQITNAGAEVADMLHGWTVVDHPNSVMYPGSTTGGSHNNEVCSPYAITWHVDKACHKVTPQSFDNLCKQMTELYKLDLDLYPHHSRILVDSAWVAKSAFVVPLA